MFLHRFVTSLPLTTIKFEKMINDDDVSYPGFVRFSRDVDVVVVVVVPNWCIIIRDVIDVTKKSRPSNGIHRKRIS